MPRHDRRLQIALGAGKSASGLSTPAHMVRLQPSMCKVYIYKVCAKSGRGGCGEGRMGRRGAEVYPSDPGIARVAKG